MKIKDFKVGEYYIQLKRFTNEPGIVFKVDEINNKFVKAYYHFYLNKPAVLGHFYISNKYFSYRLATREEIQKYYFSANLENINYNIKTTLL